MAFAAGEVARRAALGRQADIADGPLLIDLSEVAFIDSAGLGAIVGGVRRARNSGTPVAVACPRPSVAHILRAAGLTAIASVFNTLEEAATAMQNLASRPGQ